MSFEHVQVGDVVTRDLVGCEMQLKVTAVTEQRIVCGSWEFDRVTGREIDEDLGWDELLSGSHLVA